MMAEITNRVLGREDEVGCVLFESVDRLERRRRDTSAVGVCDDAPTASIPVDAAAGAAG